MAEAALPIFHYVDEFLAWEIQQPERYEFVAGVLTMMAGGSENHDLIGSNAIGLLFERLKGGPCRVHGSNLKVRSARAIMYPDAFVRQGASLGIASPECLQEAVRELRDAGWIKGWRDERYEVRGQRGQALFTLERAAFRRLGLQARAVHLNGWVRDGAGWRLWIARRSAAKPVDPGMLDNLVGGGIGAGYSPLETLLKECGEEAGLPETLARQAVPAGRFRVQRGVPDGVHDETIHAFDLELPEGFVPSNRDGEVAEFTLLDAGEAAARLAAGAFTVDAGVVTIDFLRRRGALRDPRVDTALDALRRDPA